MNGMIICISPKPNHKMHVNTEGSLLHPRYDTYETHQSKSLPHVRIF